METREILEKIDAAARKYNLDPRFVLSLAEAENPDFDPNAVSPAGAIGIMQITPDTAKTLKIDPHNIDENIEGGVRYLSQIAKRPWIANDPYSVAFAYNAGPDHKYLKSREGKIPVETEQYLQRIQSIYGGVLPYSVNPEEQGERNISGWRTTPANLPKEAETLTPSQKRFQEEMLGGFSGAALGSTLLAGSEVPFIRDVLDKFSGAAGDMNKALPRWGLQRYLNSQIPAYYRLPLQELERMVGTKLRTMSEIQDALKVIKPSAEQVVEVPKVAMVKGRSVPTYERTGQFITRTIPPKEGVDLEPWRVGAKPGESVARSFTRGVGNVLSSLPFRFAGAAANELANLGDVSRAAEYDDKTGEYLGGLGAILSPGLLFKKTAPVAGPALSAVETYRRLREGDPVGASVEAAAGALPLAARAISQRAGLPGAIISSFAPSAYDLYRSQVESAEQMQRPKNIPPEVWEEMKQQTLTPQITY
jgi:hypothetical protein